MPTLLTANPQTRSSYTMEELRDRVLGDLGLRDNGLITENDIDRWAMEAQDKLCQESRWYKVIDYIGASGGVNENELPAKCLGISYVDYDSIPLSPVVLSDLHISHPYWRSDTGTPSHYYMMGGNAIGLYPAPAASSGAVLMVIYTALAPEPVGDDDFYYCPPGAEDAIVHYCCWKASVKDAGGEGKLRDNQYAALWAHSLRQIKRQVRGLGENIPVVYGRKSRRRGIGWPSRNYTVPAPE